MTPDRAGPQRHQRWLFGLALVCLASGCAHPRPAAGLRPLPLLMVGFWTADPLTREVDSLQPTLRWEAFPRPEDLGANKAGRLAAGRNPTYEVRVWRAEADFPEELVYARSGLTEPVHTIETPFAPETLYLWTVRARFELDGAPRATEWGVLILPLRPETEIPHPGYYRFKTPAR